MALARLTFARPAADAPPDGITLVVFAPYGSDIELSGYPDTRRKPIEEHPLVLHLAQVDELAQPRRRRVLAGDVDCEVRRAVDIAQEDRVIGGAGHRAAGLFGRLRRHPDLAAPIAQACHRAGGFQRRGHGSGGAGVEQVNGHDRTAFGAGECLYCWHDL